MSMYYVSAASGSDVNNGSSEALAWAHVDKAMNTVVAGDKVWVKADGNYNELATIDTVGTTISPIIFEGYSSVTGDNGQAIIDGQSTRVNCITNNILIISTARIYYVFKNFRFTGATAEGVLLVRKHTTWKNCKFDTNGTIGLDAEGSRCEICEFSSNATRGCQNGAGGGIFISCKFYNNGTDGLVLNGHGVISWCEFFSNAGDHVSGGGTEQIFAILNCTFDGDAKDTTRGIAILDELTLIAMVNNVIYDCATGVHHAGDWGERVISRNNLVNANTTAYNNAATFTGELTSAPQFTDEVNGADYTPAAGSPLINAGLNG